ncbi:carboxymuconolactone decarboxylase family protein [Amycolatopsis anabasis]|uniref:carboxymuconolactone decarboxylase family protein n=1 Tax=Amycolatopsis anabasis TaxID=1840409 RepID=UPI00131C9979|nr:carboxymuconolactone decarboxylase family protein [Amycolatopsis anabasis]
MTDRIQITAGIPRARKLLIALYTEVARSATEAGLDPKLVELTKIRVSQINGCAYCTDQHSRDARELGEDERRIFLLPAWRETELYTEQERAALALAEAMTRVADVQDVPDEVYLQATKALTEDQYLATAWMAAVMNAFTRLGVTSHKPLPEKVSA